MTNNPVGWMQIQRLFFGLIMLAAAGIGLGSLSGCASNAPGANETSRGDMVGAATTTGVAATLTLGSGADFALSEARYSRYEPPY